jgi:transcriptional repressor NrdR
MKCPFCNFDDTIVKDSRPADDGRTIRRRRECPECGRRFTTFERFHVQQIIVVKRSGLRELFDREKLLRGISVAVRKRPVQMAQIEKLVSDIEQHLTESGKSEIGSQELGETVLMALKELDSVAYVRYASVYHDFQHPEDFMAVVLKKDGK